MLNTYGRGVGRSDHPLVHLEPRPVAEPKGTQAETLEAGDTAVLDAVSDGQSYEERASLAFRALEAGHTPQEINDKYTAPFDTDDSAGGGEPDKKSETAEGDPAEATGGEQPPEETGEGGNGESQQPKLPDLDEGKLEKFLAAKRVLQRDQLTDTDIENLGIDRAIELAESRSKSHAEIDRRFSEPKPKDDQGSEDASQQTNDEGGSAAEQYIAEVREYDEGLADKLEGVLQGSEKQAQSAQAEIARHKLQVKIEQVSVRYPEMKDQGVFDQVLDKAKQLVKSPVYQDPGDALEDAAAIILAPRREQRAQDKLLEDNRNQRNGQIDTDTVVDTDTKPMNQDQRETYAMKLLGDGKTPAEVKAILNKIPYPEE